MATATTVWRATGAPLVLPLTISLGSIHGARLCDARWPRLGWLDEPSA